MSRISKRITIGLMAASAAAWIGWDIYVAVDNIPGNTESEIIRDFANQHAWFAFAVGVLMGHFFWNVKKKTEWWKTVVVFPGLVAALYVAQHLTSFYISPAIPFLGGFVAGRILWPQKPKEKK